MHVSFTGEIGLSLTGFVADCDDRLWYYLKDSVILAGFYLGETQITRTVGTDFYMVKAFSKDSGAFAGSFVVGYVTSLRSPSAFKAVFLPPPGRGQDNCMWSQSRLVQA